MLLEANTNIPLNATPEAVFEIGGLSFDVTTTAHIPEEEAATYTYEARKILNDGGVRLRQTGDELVALVKCTGNGDSQEYTVLSQSKQAWSKLKCSCNVSVAS